MTLTHPFERMQLAVRDERFRLHEHIKAPELPPSKKLGLRNLHHMSLKLSDYVQPGALEAVPAAVHRSHLSFPWGALLNDQLGDCGEAMTIHGIEAFHLDAGTPVPAFGNDDAEKLYEQVGGYDPTQTQPDGSNPTDQGTDNGVLVTKWQEPGVTCAADKSQHSIVASLFVDYTNTNLTKLAIWEFVVCFRAMNMPVTAQNQTTWSVTDPTLQGNAAPGSWGGHDIPELSYDQNLIRTVSWGEELLIEWGFDTTYGMQGFVVVTKEQTNLQGVSPAGVDWTKLNQDIAALPPAPQSQQG